ncbi:MAG: 4-hydroxy-tetrahydrodipicolinate reductase [Ignavibacteria bacterium GWB2_35_12]|nr:MAG: 4-hydroxy-tetrahydrodipicolinate reductase [Ignavibacteria bacterium GWA2_35_8]OGU41907.1 MAG: 4-hydroxy-tetrahydrodipicolinate reductase [Ignavibacteria bacterium GWB2_35_12]OGU87186.1 MAG: 4-hydroxy-tetrahydrodipicolinate reductase [Ignavibacteria bacterium RIFOXYA2_FULL_35_10]OGV24581.1 MAG: 4-hydroxy-tetrahydrodipicolinate reductase [Ignavibacteria bacterium RIFOXYC2_FULL_35_21]
MNSSLPKIAIVGYGSMGREIEKAAIRRGFKVTDIFEIDNPIDERQKYNFDVAIDFTFPDSVIENIRKLSILRKNIVIGTTGWDAHTEEIKKYVKAHDIGLVYGSNFSVGMQMFFRIVEQTSKLLDKIENYDVSVHEIHHTRKKDSPSGTAKSLAEIILKNVNRKKKILEETVHGSIAPDMLHVTSSRVGEVTGTHTIMLDSDADSIELIHRAKNRSGFAHGALLATEWIQGKKGFHDFKDVMSDLWNKV